MWEFYDVAEKFLKTLDDVGDYLLSEPLNAIIPSGLIIPEWINAGYPDWMIKLLSSIHSASLADLLIGSLLVGILSFKLVKFFLDLFF